MNTLITYVKFKYNKTAHNKLDAVSHWIVVTTISHPTEDLKKLASIPGWQVVVVGDQKTPQNWNFSGVFYLDVYRQKQLGYKIFNKLPYNSYSRKMIGYLFAIENGAKYIYDTDDDNHPSKGNIDFHLDSTMSGLIYDDLNHLVVNPLPHFGQEDIWPRGYPLDLVSIKPNRSYRLCTFNTPAIQQGLVNGDPDVDAIYRLINKGSDKSKIINVTFDSRAPPMILPSGVFAPFNSQNTLFSYNAFWALFLPITVDFRVTDIWRGYWAQRLLWLTGQHLAFFPPNAVQYRNPHSYLKDFDEEIQMYEEAMNLIKFLNSWDCSSNTSFFICVMALTREMVENNFIKFDDYELMRLWLEDLESAQYKEPSFAYSSIDQMCIDSYHWVQYLPPLKSYHGFQDLVETCDESFENQSFPEQNTSTIFDITKQPIYNFNNILLVIVFNFPHIDNIRMLEALYRDHFPNILFCSETKSMNDLYSKINSKRFKWRNNPISFVNITSNGGWYGYECAIRAIEMNYKVDGYLILGDDVLFKFWKIYNFDVTRTRTETEIYEKPRHHNRSVDKINPWWMWWPMKCGKNATNLAMDEIIQLSKSMTDSRATIFQKFIDNHYDNNLNMTNITIGMSDFYFIAKQDTSIFLDVAKVFLKHQVFLEIAVPTIVSGCQVNTNYNDGFPGVSLWGGNRGNPTKYFKNFTVYVHPLKLKELQNNRQLLQSYCNNYIMELLNNW
ncbi:hypothetical protein CHUAL_001966 [Chamberlinius hualienensis]